MISLFQTLKKHENLGKRNEMQDWTQEKLITQWKYTRKNIERIRDEIYQLDEEADSLMTYSVLLEQELKTREENKK